MITGNEPIYPQLEARPHPMDATIVINESSGGMTYRQWLAGMAMQGLLANDSDRRPENIAKDAVEYTDALIAELNKQP